MTAPTTPPPAPTLSRRHHAVLPRTAAGSPEIAAAVARYVESAPDAYETRTSNKRVRDALFAADRRCRYCGCGIRKTNQATLDHILPVSRGGSDGAENLTLACQRCNVSKGERTPAEWAASILAARPAAADDALAWAAADAEWGRVGLGPNAAPLNRGNNRAVAEAIG